MNSRSWRPGVGRSHAGMIALHPPKPLKPHTFCDNIPRLVGMPYRGRLGSRAEVAELVDALDLGSSVL